MIAGCLYFLWVLSERCGAVARKGCEYCKGGEYLVDEGSWLEPRKARIRDDCEICVEIYAGDGDTVGMSIPIAYCPKCGRKFKPPLKAVIRKRMVRR